MKDLGIAGKGSCNSMADGSGTGKYGGGSPKATNMGKDISGNATNQIGGFIHKTKAESPNAKSHSRNQ